MNQTPKPIVWVTQESDFDYSQAEELGEIKFVTAKDFRSFMQSVFNEDLSAEIRSKIASFDHSKDYLLFSGSPYVSAAVLAELVQMSARRPNKVRILRWSNRDRKYQPFTMNIGE